MWRGLHARLGVNPVETVEHFTGDWALNLLWATLAIRPLVRATGWSFWMGRRRVIGLFVAFYATLHFLTYLLLDMELRMGEFFRDINRRPYIFVGAGALLLLVPLAVTSNDWSIRVLRKWWKRVHWLTYPAAALAALHYYLSIKKDKTLPLGYAAALAALLAWRVAVVIAARHDGSRGTSDVRAAGS